MLLRNCIVRTVLSLAYLVFTGYFSCAYAGKLDPSISQQAIELANELNTYSLETNNRTIDEELERVDLLPEKRLSLMRYQFWYAIRIDDQDELQARSRLYFETANQIGNERDKNVAKLFDAFSRYYSFNDVLNLNHQAVRALQPYLESDDWFIKHRALYFLTVLDDRFSDPHLGLESSKDAFLLIPQKENTYVNEAKIISYEDMAYLYNLLKNPELAIVNTKSLLALSRQEQVPISANELIGNFMYAFGSWRDAETTSALGEVLLKIEEHSTNRIQGLTEMRLSRSSNELGQYEKALKYAQSAMEVAEFESIKEGSKLNEIIALAGLQRTKEAKQALSNFLSDQTKDGNKLNAKYQKRLNYARALISLNEGDNAGALKYFNARLDDHVLDILTANTSETQSMLARLQNSKERELERQEALERESSLKEVALIQQKKVNQLLSIVTCVFGFGAVAAFLFARYRTKISKTLAIAADKAQAGEKAKTEFLAVASHELRTPLNGIIGLSDTMRRQIKDPDLNYKTGLVYKSGMELLGVVENILEMTQIESGTIKIYPDPVHIRDIIANLQRIWSAEISEKIAERRKDIKFTCHIDDSVPEIVVIDGFRFEQCVKNLLSNAVKFTEQGRIHMHVTASEPDANGKTVLKVIIADTGVGIAQDAIGSLFTPFSQADSSRTRAHGGAGLGLAITKSLMDMMGGEISLLTKSGRGTEFTLDFPVTLVPALDQVLPVKIPGQKAAADSEKAMPPSRPRHVSLRSLSQAASRPAQAVTEKAGPAEDMLSVYHDERRLSGLNILIIEDNPDNQNVIKSYLEPSGCALTFAENGRAGLDALAASHFDLVFLDISMPVMDGIDTLKAIRRGDVPDKDLPIIMLSANVDPATHNKCMVLGANLFVKKPVSARELLEAIEFVQAQKRPADDSGALAAAAP